MRSSEFLLRRSVIGLGRFGGEQGDINIFEDLTRSDAKNAVGGFDEVVALASGVLTAEHVSEGEAGGELLGLDQKASTVGDPRSCFHELLFWSRCFGALDG